nr:immunoglobulin heavy chain junction region [Mus musculus]
CARSTVVATGRHYAMDYW